MPGGNKNEELHESLAEWDVSKEGSDQWPLPLNLAMAGTVAPGWELIRPIELLIDRDTDGSYVATDDVFHMFGHGATAAAAAADHMISLVEYYRLVSRHEDVPSRSLFSHLREYLRPTSNQ